MMLLGFYSVQFNLSFLCYPFNNFLAKMKWPSCVTLSSLMLLNDLGCIGRHELSLGNTFTAEKGQTPPNKEFPPQVDISSSFGSLVLYVCVYYICYMSWVVLNRNSIGEWWKVFKSPHFGTKVSFVTMAGILFLFPFFCFATECSAVTILNFVCLVNFSC